MQIKLTNIRELTNFLRKLNPSSNIIPSPDYYQCISIYTSKDKLVIPPNFFFDSKSGMLCGPYISVNIITI